MRRFLRPVEHGVEIDCEYAAPFLFARFDGAHRLLRDAGIVDQDGDGAEGFFGGVEGARHGGTVGDVGFDRDGFAAFAFDLVFQRFESIRPPRHQRHRSAVVGQRMSELRAEPAGGAGHQRHAAGEIEHRGGFHVAPLTPPGCA